MWKIVITQANEGKTKTVLKGNAEWAQSPNIKQDCSKEAVIVSLTLLYSMSSQNSVSTSTNQITNKKPSLDPQSKYLW